MHVCTIDNIHYGRFVLTRVHNKGREESVEHAIRVYSSSSQSNVTSCIAHVSIRLCRVLPSSVGVVC